MIITVSEVPHIAIEPTMKCNIDCRICYNLNRNYEKTLEEVKNEIDLARTKRNLDTISLLGGEPTLHPEIAEIIRYVKSCGLHCQLLTNGIIFLNDHSDVLLDRIVSAGVNRIILHMDSGQRRFHQDLDDDIAVLFTKFGKRKTACSLAMTIYDNNISEVSENIIKFSKFSCFDGVLATLERDAGEVINNKLNPDSDSGLLKLHDTIRHHMKIEPTTYLPTSLNRDRISWLLYFYYINAVTGETFRISSKLNAIFRNLYRSMTGHHVFGMKVPSIFRLPLFLITAFMELLIDPRRTGAFFSLIKKSSLLRSIRFHYIVIQDGPRYNAEKDCLEFCYHCPDATIRNGMITPVCLADQINPLVGGRKKTDRINEAYLTVYKHLEEIGQPC